MFPEGSTENFWQGEAVGTLVSYCEGKGYFQPAGLTRPLAGQPGTPLSKRRRTNVTSRRSITRWTAEGVTPEKKRGRTLRQ